MRLWVLLGVLCTVMFSLIPCPLHAESQLRFGVYTTDKPTVMVKKLRPVLNALETDLSQRLGESVTIRLIVKRPGQKRDAIQRFLNHLGCDSSKLASRRSWAFFC